MAKARQCRNSLGEMAVREGYLTREELERALREQCELKSRGQEALLGRLLLERGYLSFRHYVQLLKLQDKLFSCRACGATYNVVGKVSERTVPCADCGAPLTVFETGAEVIQGKPVVAESPVKGRLPEPPPAVPRRRRWDPAPKSRRGLLVALGVLSGMLAGVILFLGLFDFTPAASPSAAVAPTAEPQQAAPPTVALEAEPPRAVLKAGSGESVEHAQARVARDLDLLLASHNFRKARELVKANAGRTGWESFLHEQTKRIEALAEQYLQEIELRCNRLTAEGKYDAAVALWRAVAAEFPERANLALTEIEQMRSAAAKLAEEAAQKRAAEESLSYRIVWEEILELAADRQYGQAIARARSLLEQVTNPEVRRELTEDISDLRLAWAAYDRAIARFRKGEEFTGEYVDASGKIARASGRIAAVTEQGIVVGDTYLRFEQLTGATLVRALKADDPGLAVFAAFERTGLPDGVKVRLREKYLPMLASTRTEAARPASVEKAAFELLRRAEREFMAKDKSAAVAIYRQLLYQYGETNVVRNMRRRVVERAGYAAEVIVNPSDWTRVGGKWSIGRDYDAPISKIVQSQENDRDPFAFNAQSDNYVETTITVVAGVKYRLWIQLGYDCTGNDSVYVQADGMRDAMGVCHSIGGPNALVVERGRSVIHATHDDVKKLKRKWNWAGGDTVTFETGGTKRLRIYLREDGTAFTQVVLSSVRFAAAAPDIDVVTTPKE